MLVDLFSFVPLRIILFVSVTAATYTSRNDPNIFHPQVPGQLDPNVFLSWLSARIQIGVSLLAVEKGTYNVTPAPGSNCHLCFTVPMSGVTLNMTGVRLILMQNDLVGVYVTEWKQCSLIGLSTQYADHPTNQGSIVDISQNNLTITIDVDEGYPLQDWEQKNTSFHSFACNIFDRHTRLWKPGTYDLSFTSLYSLGNRRFVMSFSHDVGPGAQNVAVGDLLGCRRIHTAFTFHVDGCYTSVFDSISLFGGTMFGFFGTDKTGPVDPSTVGANHFINCKILCPPPPRGSTTEPLLSTGADGFHASGLRHGPIIENCHFERMSDDGIAIHGRYLLIINANSTNIVVQKFDFQLGDWLRLYDKEFIARGNFQINSVLDLPHTYRPPGGQTQSQTMPKRFNPKGPFTLLGISSSTPIPKDVGFDFVTIDANRTGNGFVLRNNTVANHRARGMLIKASNGVIENNRINGSTLGGIIITPELYWGEGDFIHNVVVRNNNITNVGYGKQSYGGIALGATDPNHMFARGYGHADIQIVGNQLSDLNTPAIWISSVQRLKLANNTILRQWKHPTWATCCPPYKFPKSTVAWLTESYDVEVSNNCVIDAGKWAITLYNYTNTVIDSKLEGGVRKC